MKKNLIQKALQIALTAHEGQIRKGDGSKYILHPLAVAFKVSQAGFDDTVVAAALCHDVMEDTEVSEDTLRKELGDEVVYIVKAVTNDDSLPWEDKKLKYIETVRKGPEGAKAICCADKIHNLESLLQAYNCQGTDLWKKFNRGKEKKLWFEKNVLQMLKDTWDHPMIKEYQALIIEEEELN